MVINGKFDDDFFPYIDLQVLHTKKKLSAIVKAIIDTGAAHCMIQEDLAKQLELEVLRTADYRHPILGKMPLIEYTMDLCFNNEDRCVAKIEGVRAGTLVDTQYPAAVIIGVEVLKKCIITYDGPAQVFTLQFSPPRS